MRSYRWPFNPTFLLVLSILAAGALSLGVWVEVLRYKRSKDTYDCSGALTLLVYYLIHWYGFLSTTFYYTGFSQ